MRICKKIAKTRRVNLVAPKRNEKIQYIDIKEKFKKLHYR